MEYDHMAELGLREEIHLLCDDVGFVTRNDPLRSLCEKYIRNGGRVFDALSRYDMLINYTLSREDGNCGNVAKMLIPLLKASGVTDAAAYSTCMESMCQLPGADKAVRYLINLMPTYFCTESYEHATMGMAESIGIPLESISCNSFSFDSFELPKPSAKAIRAMMPAIASCQPGTTHYSITEDRYLSKEDARLVETIDTEFIKPLAKLEMMDDVRKNLKVSGNEKAYALLELCKKNSIAISDSVVIGSRDSDFPLMDIVRDSSGLSMAFNGTEYAVRASNVAVLSDRPIVAAVLAGEFYNGGIETVHSMVEHWNVEDLRTMPCSDRNLMNEMLAQFRDGLPEVYWITHDNVKKVAKRSIEHRRSAGFR